MNGPAEDRPGPGYLETLEGGVLALIEPGRLFGKLRASPPLPMRLSLAAVSTWTFCAGLTVWMRQVLEDPESGGAPLYLLAAVAAAAVSGPVAGGLVRAVLRASGGQPDREGAFRTAAHLAPVLPCVAVASWVPYLWLAPAFYGLVLLVKAAQTLHGSKPGRSWGVALPLGGLLLGFQYTLGLWTRMQDERLEDLMRQTGELERRLTDIRAATNPARQTEQMLRTTQDLMDSLSHVMGPSGMPPPPGPSPVGQPTRSGTRPEEYLAVPGGRQKPPAAPRGLDTLKQTQDLALELLQEMKSNLKDPSQPKALTDEQVQKFQRLLGLSNEVQKTLPKKGKKK